MAAGILVGLFCFPTKFQKNNARFQLVCTVLLIFSMGVSLGKRPKFLQELREIGLDSLLFALIPIVCSVGLVYLLTHFLMEKKQ